MVQRRDYDAWGNVLEDTSPGFVPFGFAGGLYDVETQLTRFGARDYDPRAGRWATRDPIRFASRSANFYTYAANNPITFVDSNGLRVYALSLGTGYAISSYWSFGGSGDAAFVDWGLAYDSETAELITYTTTGRTTSRESITGFSAGFGLTLAWLDGCLSDFLGEGREEAITGPISVAGIETSSGRRGTAVSFGGRGFGASLTKMTTYTTENSGGRSVPGLVSSDGYLIGP